MNTFLRSLTVWLLMLALPWQGLAAASMLACAPAEGMPQAAQMQMQMQHAMQPGMQEQQEPPCHEAAAEPEAGKKPVTATHAGDARCANCGAACSVGAAVLPASSPALAPLPPPTALPAIAERTLPSVHLAQPERPPRRLLA